MYNVCVDNVIVSVYPVCINLSILLDISMSIIYLRSIHLFCMLEFIHCFVQNVNVLRAL